MSTELSLSPTATEPPRPGRPRSAAADLAIREATLSLLVAGGYGNLTMSGVAAAAGVSTATLYRRWRSKLELVVAVLQARADEHPVPNTGSLLGDCRAILRGVVTGIRTSPTNPIFSTLIGEIGRNPELAEAFRTNLMAPRRATLAAMLRRAEARGELRPGLDDELVIDLLFGPIYYRLLVSGGRLNAAVADELAELVVAAIGTGV